MPETVYPMSYPLQAELKAIDETVYTCFAELTSRQRCENRLFSTFVNGYELNRVRAVGVSGLPGGHLSQGLQNELLGYFTAGREFINYLTTNFP